MNGFDLLLKRNVQHIWEKIFLNLDYQTLRNCARISKAWKEILEGESLRLKIAAKYSWMNTENLEQRIWRSEEYITAWTCYDDEIAFVQELGTNQVMHWINKNGKLRSRNFKDKDNYVINIWILKHVILVRTDKAVFAFEKQVLKHLYKIPTLDGFLDDGEKCEKEITNFNPCVGVRILSFIVNPGWPIPNDQNVKYVLREVPYDYNGEESLRVCTYKEGYFSDEEGAVITFSEDGSHFIYRAITPHQWLQDGLIKVYSIEAPCGCSCGCATCYRPREAEKSELRIRSLWHDNALNIGRVVANSRYVSFYHQVLDRFPDAFITYVLVIAHIRDGRRVGTYDIPTAMTDDQELSNFSISLTERHAVSSFSGVRGKKVQNGFLIVDLNTGEETHSVGEEVDLDGDYGEGEEGIDEGIRIHSGKIKVQTNVWPDPSRILLTEVTSGDAERVRKGQRSITTKSKTKSSADKAFGSIPEVENLTEVRPGLCLFETDISQDDDDVDDDTGFVLEMVSWPNEQLPKALATWTEWLVEVEM